LLLVAASICPATAEDFAAATGRTRASIYPHLEALARADFLVVEGHRPSARRPVAIYGAGPMLHAQAYDPSNFVNGKEWTRASDAFFRMHSREHRSSIKIMNGGSTLIQGLDLHYLFSRIMHLDRAGMLELIELKNKIRDFGKRYSKPVSPINEAVSSDTSASAGTGTIVRLLLAMIPDQRSLQKRGGKKAVKTPVKTPAKTPLKTPAKAQ
jgi:hypothetical protein